MTGTRLHSRKFCFTAVALLVVYVAVTTTVDLFHNHSDMVERADCPACLWLQMSQDSDPDTSPTDQIISSFDVVSFLSPPLEEVGILHNRDASNHKQIRAPPTA